MLKKYIESLYFYINLRNWTFQMSLFENENQSIIYVFVFFLS